MKTKDVLNLTRGGRVSRIGFRVCCAGLAIFPIGLLLQLANPGQVVDLGLVALLILVCAIGLAIVLVGARIDKRAMAEYDRRVDAGKQRPWQPGDRNPLG